MPGLVNKGGITAHAEDFCVVALELVVQYGHLFEFGRTDKGEVRGIEDEDHPFAPVLGELDLFDLVRYVGIYF